MMPSTLYGVLGVIIEEFGGKKILYGGNGWQFIILSPHITT